MSFSKNKLVSRVALFAFPFIAVFVIVGYLGIGEQRDPIFRVAELIAQQNFSEALSTLDNMDTRDAWDTHTAALQRAICLMNLGKYPDALAILQSSGTAHKEIADYVAFWMGQCAEALGQAKDAEDHYAKILHIKPVSLLGDQATLNAARASLAQGNAEGAIAYYHTLIDKRSHEGDALAGLVKAQTALGDSIAAREMRLKLIKNYPKHPAAYKMLPEPSDMRGVEELFYAGVACMHAGKYQQAIVLLRRVIDEAQDATWRGKAQYELGHVYYRTRKYLKAENAFDRAFKVYHRPEALFYLGRCAIKRGQDLTGTTRFREFVRRYPSSRLASEALWQAAMAYERRGRHSDARKLFLKLATNYPKSTYADQAAWRAGFALYQTRQYTAASKAFLRLSRQTSASHLRDQGYYWAGKCYQKLGQKAEARFWIERASEGFPTSYYSTRAHAVLGKTENTYIEAPQPGEHLSAGQSYTPSAHIPKGDVLASIGLYRYAEREYDRARHILGRNLFALDDLKPRYERVRAMHKALQVSAQIVMLERAHGISMTRSSFRRLYPTYYWGEINQIARKMNLDPNLMIAIMRQESAFNTTAVSRAGARGLMQVMPQTGRDMARLVKLKNFSTEDLHDPQTSILLGGKHLSDHMRAFRKDKHRQLSLALSAYNAGLDAAKRWAKRLTKQDVDEFIERIPYKETRNYVKLVYRNYRVYSYLNNTQAEVEISLGYENE
jgi:soluble lytic murein transglycosylase